MKVHSIVMKAHLGVVELALELWSSPRSCFRGVEAFPGVVGAHTRGVETKLEGVDNHSGVMETHPLAIEIKTHPRAIWAPLGAVEATLEL